METHHLISADGKIFGVQLSILEAVGWLGNAVFSPVFGAMARHRKTQTGNRSAAVLVVEPGRLAVAAVLRYSRQKRSCDRFRVRVYLDTLHTKSHHSSPP